MTSHTRSWNQSAPRGYCKECGAALIDKGTHEVPDWTVYNVGAKFDEKTGRPIDTKLWREWECPNKEFVTVKVGDISIPRGWVHSSYTDYDVKGN